MALMVPTQIGHRHETDVTHGPLTSRPPHHRAAPRDEPRTMERCRSPANAHRRCKQRPSVNAYSRRYNLSSGQLYWWRQRLAASLSFARSHTNSPGLRFVRVVAQGPTPVGQAGRGVAVRIGALTVEVERVFCEETLCRVPDVVAARAGACCWTYPPPCNCSPLLRQSTSAIRSTA